MIFEYNVCLIPIVQDLDICDLFDMSKADLSEVSSEPALCGTGAFHKVLLKVNKASTEAAVATFFMVGGGMRHNRCSNHANKNRFFVFIILCMS